MVRNYKKRSNRGEWSKQNMKEAVLVVKQGVMSCLTAATTYDVPEATLRRYLKKKDEVDIIIVLQ